MKRLIYVLVLAGILTSCAMTSKNSINEPNPLQSKVDSLQTALDEEKFRSMSIELEAQEIMESCAKYAKKAQEEIKSLKNDLELCLEHNSQLEGGGDFSHKK